MAVQLGAHYLESPTGQRGSLGGVPGVPAADGHIGAGTVSHAAKVAIGMGAQVSIIDTNLDRLRLLDNLWRQD